MNTSGFGGVKGELEQILTRTANHSIARNTWRSYTSYLRSIEKMEVDHDNGPHSVGGHYQERTEDINYAQLHLRYVGVPHSQGP